jgi:hypothetical protein
MISMTIAADSGGTTIVAGIIMDAIAVRVVNIFTDR